MNTLLKVLAVFLLLIGESLAIYSEMVAARNFNMTRTPLAHMLLRMFLLMTLAGGFLLLGYLIGFSSFKNIWIVSIASIVSILIVEPILAWTMFKQVPSMGSIIGLILSMIGFIVALVF